jgi:hypothetical protein
VAAVLSRSSGLVDQTFFQWLTGKAVKASSVAQHRLQLAELPAQHPRDHIELLMDVGGIRLGEIVRMAVATISADPLGTWGRTLRRSGPGSAVPPRRP